MSDKQFKSVLFVGGTHSGKTENVPSHITKVTVPDKPKRPMSMTDYLDSKRISVRGWTVEGTIRHTETGYDPERHNALLFPPDKRRTMPWERSSGFYPCP